MRVFYGNRSKTLKNWCFALAGILFLIALSLILKYWYLINDDKDLSRLLALLFLLKSSIDLALIGLGIHLIRSDIQETLKTF